MEPDSIGPIRATIHRTRTGDQVEIALTRLEGDGEPGPPVVLVAGTFCQRSFWVSNKGIGLGPTLLDRGLDVWILEQRGHGRSPRDARFPDWTAEDQLRFDLPAAQRVVREHTGQPAHWVGHSWGGVAIVGSLAGGWLDPAEGCRELYDAVGSADKQWVLLGRAEGFSHDYGHLEMIIGHDAQDEVWPRIAAWIEAHWHAAAAPRSGSSARPPARCGSGGAAPRASSAGGSGPRRRTAGRRWLRRSGP